MSSKQDGNHGACFQCGRRYGDEYGFPDLMIGDKAWEQIMPERPEGGGLLCPSCICYRLHEAGIKTIGYFASGPIRSVKAPEGEQTK